MARLLARARTMELPEAGHASILEQHRRFNAELRRFAGRVLGPRRRERAG